MRREGRQHGFVQTRGLSRSPTNPRVLHQLDSRPTAGVFTKVPAKPTNHSKFTGCRDKRPVSKSKHKAKGSHKNRRWWSTTTTTTTTQSPSDLPEFDEDGESSGEASESEADPGDIAVVGERCESTAMMERLLWEGGGGEGVGRHHVLDDEWEVAYHPDDVLAGDSVVVASDAPPSLIAGVAENDQEDWLVITTNNQSTCGLMI